MEQGPVLGYQCPACGFVTDKTHCDYCQGVVRWDDEVGGSAHCEHCGRKVHGITCRKCGESFAL